eukprot:12030757-Alexandrium_andersonii.AAC.1
MPSEANHPKPEAAAPQRTPQHGEFCQDLLDPRRRLAEERQRFEEHRQAIRDEAHQLRRATERVDN